MITVYLGLELLTLSQYALVALNRDSPRSAEAGMKYFVLGALASGLLLYGMSMIYGAAGTLDLQKINVVVGDMAHSEHRTMLAFGLVFLIAGIAFKFGAAPFHMWIPDVYQGAPTAMVVFVGSAPKLAAFGMAYRLLEGGMAGMHEHWSMMIAVLSALSLAIGNVFAIAQSNLKRMLGYSTISHIGFLLLGFVNGTPSGFAAALFYAISYALMATVAFGVILLLARAGFEAEGSQPAQSLVRGGDGDRDVLARGRAAAVRLLRQAHGAEGGHRRGTAMARDRRDRVRDHRALLLPARRQGHVFRRAGRRNAARAAERSCVPLGAFDQRARAARARRGLGSAARLVHTRFCGVTAKDRTTENTENTQKSKRTYFFLSFVFSVFFVVQSSASALVPQPRAPCGMTAQTLY
jgi:hypothetical protein